MSNPSQVEGVKKSNDFNMNPRGVNVDNGFFSAWNSKEKIIIASFVFLSFFIIILGFFQFYQNKTITIADMFGVTPNYDDSSDSAPVDFFAQLSGVSGGDLSLIDTDKDGLSDYDELNVYNTSPYLEDTDGDAIFDKVEISAGTDPNCPTGSTCGLSQSSGDTEKEKTNSPLTFGQISTGGEVNISDAGSFDTTLLKGDLNPEDLRSFLKQGGISDEYLNKVDDGTLISLYKDTLGSMEEIPDVQSSQELGASGDLANFSPAQVRDLMVQGGVDRSVVDGLSDEEVMSIYRETLSNLKL